MASLGELRSWQATDVGQVRDQNEDNFLVDRKLRLYIVCDGMGGHAAGEIASSMTCKEMREALLSEKERLLAYDQGAPNVTRHDVIAILESAVQRACQRVHQIGIEDESKRGMGTTLDAMLILGGRGFIAHVGDSRIYLSRGGSVHQLTEDHSLINELLKRGKLTRDQIATVQYKNAVTRAMAVYESVEADVLDFDVLPGDRYLLCSDGLHGYLEEAEIPRLFQEIGEDALVDHLIALANERGGKDNITAVVVQVPKGEAGADDLAQEVHLKLEVLHRLPLFRNVTYQELVRILNVTSVRSYKAGDDVVREGDEGDELLVVLRGTLRSHAAGVDRGTLAVGDSLGEMALVDHAPCDSTVTANGPCRLLSMKRRDFFDLVRKDRDIAVKLLWSLLQVIAQRYRSTSHDLVDIRSEVSVVQALLDEAGAGG